MWSSSISLSVGPWILFAQSFVNLDAVPVLTAAPTPSGVAVEIRDHAQMFSVGADRRARQALEQIHREHGIPVVIETIPSLEGAWIADIAQERIGLVHPNHLYILVAASEWDVAIIAARDGPATRLTNPQREQIRQAFLRPLQVGWEDVALEQGVGALGSTLAAPVVAHRELSGWVILVGLMGFGMALAILIDWRIWRKSRRETQWRSAAGIHASGLARFASSVKSTSSRVSPRPSAIDKGESISLLQTSASRCRKASL